MIESHANDFPAPYVEFLRELAFLSPEPVVTNTALGLGLPLELMAEPGDNTWIDFGCVSIEQDSSTGETTLWHTYSDGPYGNPMNPEFFEGEVSIGCWPMEDDSKHYLEHEIDTFSWSLLNGLVQALDGSLDPEHDSRICSGVDDDFATSIRSQVLKRLKPFSTLSCDCGEWASQAILDLEIQL